MPPAPLPEGGPAVVAGLAGSAVPAAPGFEPFTLAHGIVVLVCAAIAVGVILLERTARTPARVRTIQRGWMLFVTGVQAWNIAFWATPPRLDPSDSLPLHLCDLAGIVAVLGLWTGNHFLRALLVYWGLALSSQAFVVPVVRDGPETVRFHLFFLSHLTIVATPLIDILARGLRPTWKDFAGATAATLAWFAVVLPLNLATGWNYGYVGPGTEDNPAAMLGPWPLRLVWMALITLAAFAAITVLARRMRPRDPVGALSVNRH